MLNKKVNRVDWMGRLLSGLTCGLEVIATDPDCEKCAVDIYNQVTKEGS